MQVNDERAVPWTKPDDLEVDLTKPMAGLGDAEPNGFAALFADGHVTMLPKTIKPEVLSALFTRAGGEVINSGDLKPSGERRPFGPHHLERGSRREIRSFPVFISESKAVDSIHRRTITFTPSAELVNRIRSVPSA